MEGEEVGTEVIPALGVGLGDHKSKKEKANLKACVVHVD